MLVCQRNADLHPNTESEQEVDWAYAAQAYTNIEEMPSFISRQRQSAAQRAFTTTADPQQLQGKQLQAYTIVQQHMEAEARPPQPSTLHCSYYLPLQPPTTFNIP